MILTKNYILLSKKTKAFTLMELLMVVVIVGILASIAIPNMRTFRLKAQLKEVEVTVETIAAAQRYFFAKGFVKS